MCHKLEQNYLWYLHLGTINPTSHRLPGQGPSAKGVNIVKGETETKPKDDGRAPVLVHNAHGTQEKCHYLIKKKSYERYFSKYF